MREPRGTRIFYSALFSFLSRFLDKISNEGGADRSKGAGGAPPRNKNKGGSGGRVKNQFFPARFTAEEQR